MKVIKATFDLEDFEDNAAPLEQALIDLEHAFAHAFCYPVTHKTVEKQVEYTIHIRDDNAIHAGAIVELIQWITLGDAEVEDA